MGILTRIVQIIKWAMAIVHFILNFGKLNDGRTFTRSRTNVSRRAKYYRLHCQLDWSLYCGQNAWNWGVLPT